MADCASALKGTLEPLASSMQVAQIVEGAPSRILSRHDPVLAPHLCLQPQGDPEPLDRGGVAAGVEIPIAKKSQGIGLRGTCGDAAGEGKALGEALFGLGKAPQLEVEKADVHQVPRHAVTSASLAAALVRLSVILESTRIVSQVVVDVAQDVEGATSHARVHEFTRQVDGGLQGNESGLRLAKEVVRKADVRQKAGLRPRVAEPPRQPYAPLPLADGILIAPS